MTDSDMDCAGLEQELAALRSELGALKQSMFERSGALYKSEQGFALMVDGFSDGLWDWNIVTGEVYYSLQWKSMLGYEDHELNNDFQTWKQLIAPLDRAEAISSLDSYLAGEKPSFEAEFRMSHRKGHEVFVLSRGVKLLRESDGRAIRMVGSHVDISGRKRIERYLASNAEILEMIAVGRPANEVYDAIALMYEERNPGMRCSMLELDGNKLLHGGAPSLPKAYCEAVNGLENGPSVGSCGTSTYTGKQVLVENIATDPKWEKIKHVALPHGMRCCWSEPIKNSSGKVLGAFGMYYDYPALPNEEEQEDLVSAARLAGIVMERDHAQKRIRQLAYFDPLTGLPSRASFQQNLEISTSHRHQRPLALFYIDLDDFKGVNDSLGHDAGDILLQEIAVRLRSCCRDGDFVARLSGDEFCVLTEAAGSSEVVSVANRCMQAVCQPFEISNRRLLPGCSIGIANYPSDGHDSASLMKAADTALYAAKGRGKNQYAFYQHELTEKAEYRFQIEQSFREAIEQELLELVFLPQMEIASGQITGVEALCHWVHPQLGHMTPAELIETAERIGIANLLTEWTLKVACQQAVSWQQQGFESISVVVNISPKHFVGHDMVSLVQQVIEQTGVTASQLELAVTEDMLQTGFESFKVFHVLKGLGVKLTINDFGSGCTSFVSLKQLNADKLKIDRCLVRDMLVDEASMILVDAMIQVGTKLGYKVIADGVDRNNQLATLKQLGCHTVQGDLLSPVVSAEEVAELLHT